MISTKPYGTTIQSDRVGGSNKDTFQTQSADAKKAFGDKDIGAVLNQIADPNWVDPKKMRKVGSSELDKDAFMKLMLEQMKNQDPTNPLQSHEMAAQLAQFTSLEQLQNMNTNIKGLVDAQKPNDKFQALAMVGKVVSSDTSLVTHAEGQEQHDIRFNLPKAAETVEISISDNQGEVVRKYEFNNLKEGENNISWNAKDDEGYDARVGDYRVNIKAKGVDGQSVVAETKTSGRITGVNFTAQGPVLLIGKQSLKMQDIKTIEDASTLQDESKKTNDITNMDLKKLDPAEDNKGKRPENNLDKVVMQKSLKEEIKKVKD